MYNKTLDFNYDIDNIQIFIVQCLDLPKLCYHPRLAADEDRVSYVLSHIAWWKFEFKN